jgi:hypothetical protein
MITGVVNVSLVLILSHPRTAACSLGVTCVVPGCEESACEWRSRLRGYVAARYGLQFECLSAEE